MPTWPTSPRRPSGPGASACWAPCSASASCWGRWWAGCWAAWTSAGPSLPPARWRCSTWPTLFRAARVAGAGPAPAGGLAPRQPAVRLPATGRAQGRWPAGGRAGLCRAGAVLAVHGVGAVRQLRFGWGPTENGWSLFAVGLVSAIVQGALLGRLLKRYTAQRLAMMGLVSSMSAFLLWGPGHRGLDDVRGHRGQRAGRGGWRPRCRGWCRPAADQRTQGQTMGAVSSLNSPDRRGWRPCSRHR